MSRPAWGEIEAMLVQMEEHQIRKVFDLARRLKPGITHEDMRNPHDFPELDDIDWHFEDGTLSGIQGVLSAVRARMRETDS